MGHNGCQNVDAVWVRNDNVHWWRGLRFRWEGGICSGGIHAKVGRKERNVCVCKGLCLLFANSLPMHAYILCLKDCRGVALNSCFFIAAEASICR